MNITEKYKDYCLSKKINFELIDKVNSYDDTTIFCPAGMQKFKNKFKDINYIGTEANIQSCIRINDFEEIGDSSHLLYFNMIGLFSFRQMSIEEAIDFWCDFLINHLSLKIDYTTIHEDKYNEWKVFYTKWNIPTRISEDCIWTDGEIGGYCTEFFINDIEIGNIVNPLGTSIDVGFGKERIEMFVNNKIIDKESTLRESILKIIDSGFIPSNTKGGYVLRKLLREAFKLNIQIDHPFYEEEIKRQTKIVERYNRLKNKHKDMPKEWWYDTHGIDIDSLS